MVTTTAERTVFVVDDDDAARDSLAMLLKSDGLTARSFASAHDFLATFDPAARGCIVTDLRMPSMDGIELIRAPDSKVSVPRPVRISNWLSGERRSWRPKAAESRSLPGSIPRRPASKG